MYICKHDQNKCRKIIYCTDRQIDGQDASLKSPSAKVAGRSKKLLLTYLKKESPKCSLDMKILKFWKVLILVIYSTENMAGTLFCLFFLFLLICGTLMFYLSVAPFSGLESKSSKHMLVESLGPAEVVMDESQIDTLVSEDKDEDMDDEVDDGESMEEEEVIQSFLTYKVHEISPE